MINSEKGGLWRGAAGEPDEDEWKERRSEVRTCAFKPSEEPNLLLMYVYSCVESAERDGAVAPSAIRLEFNDVQEKQKEDEGLTRLNKTFL